MDVAIILHVAVALMLIPSGTVAVLPNGQCFVEGVTCELDSAIGVINGVTSAEDCKLACQDNTTECRHGCQMAIAKCLHCLALWA